MKRLLIILLGLAPFFLAAQDFQGKISYNHKTKIDIDEEIPINREIEGITVKNVKVELIFNKTESLYRARPIEMPDMSTYGSLSATEQERLGNRYKRAFGAQEHDYLHRNLASDKVSLRKTIRGKRFLISQLPNVGQWELISGKKQIAGYSCLKATKTENGKEIVAWYTKQIPIAAGPATYSELPGIILEVNVANGQILISTELVELGAKYNADIVAPSKGKKVTLVEFNEIKSAKDKEMELLRQEDMRAEGANNRD